MFGKNRVSSNFIIGLGETDACVQEGVEVLTGMGVIPNLRPISPHPLRKGQITIERPSSYRLITLARMTRAALERHGLDVSVAQTMCLPCTALHRLRPDAPAGPVRASALPLVLGFFLSYGNLPSRDLRYCPYIYGNIHSINGLLARSVARSGITSTCSSQDA